MYKLTVVIPSYNLKQFSKKCIDSFLNQRTSFDFNIIVIDDCSLDGTYDYLHTIYKENKNVIVLQNDRNLGYELNTKKCMNISNSEYTCYLDIDDYLVDVDYLERSIQFLDKNQEYSCVAGSYKHIYPNHEILPSDARYYYPRKEICVNLDFHTCNYALFARVFRNEHEFLDTIKYRTELLHVDWISNYELTMNGKKIKSEIDRWCGYYRITYSGKLSGRCSTYANKMHIETITHLQTYYINNNGQNNFNNYIIESKNVFL